MNSKSACDRKVKYSRKEAKLQVQLRKSKGRGVGSYYRCTNCRKYHVTSMPANAISERTWRLISKK